MPIPCIARTLTSLHCPSARTPQNAANKPKPPPASESRTLSVSNWRPIRSRPAPSAARTAQQHEQPSLHLADHLLVQPSQRQNRLAPAAPAPLAPALAEPNRRRFGWLNTLRDCSQLGLRLLERHAGFQSSNGFHKPHAFTKTPKGSPACTRFTKRQRNPKLKPFWILKARRKNAHDDVTLLVQCDRAPEHVRVAAKSALPEAVSENGRPG